ncbi:beta-ketoacyl-ACP synthase II [candidate division KSB1 bacterium]|nr:beta-ketoacyl-ACP synthase II [candidate division KSB1 bacterium]
MKKRVVITGMGAITPIGLTVDTYWQALLAGTNGISTVTRFEVNDNFPSRIAGEIKNFDVANYLDRKEARRIDRFAQYGLAAAIQAYDDAKINLDKVQAERIGVIASSGIGGMETLEDQYFALFEKGPRRISPFFVPMLIPDILPGHISIKYHFKGPNYSTVSACASSAHAIGNAYHHILLGDADIMFAGGAEAAITPMGLAGFGSMKALSTRNDAPERASRPFDAERDGFVIGEGAGIIVLEELEHARKRNAKIYCELAGYGATADAYHVTAPPPGGEGAARAMKNALVNANVAPSDVDYINAHGTSTPPNDREETAAIKSVFGEDAYKIAISSTKSMIGHLLGAGGAVECIAMALSIVNGKIHPNLNYEVPDPECDLSYVVGTTIEREVNAAISNSFGFGGHNVCLVAKKYEDNRGNGGK